MHLDCPRARAEFVGNRLVGQADDEEIEHLALAWGQRSKSRRRFSRRRFNFANPLALLQRTMHGIAYLLFLKRLLKEVDRTSLHRADSYRDVALSGHNNDGQGEAPRSFSRFCSSRP